MQRMTNADWQKYYENEAKKKARAQPQNGYQNPNTNNIGKAYIPQVQTQSKESQYQDMFRSMSERIAKLEAEIKSLKTVDIVKEGAEAQFKRDYLDTIQNLDDDNMSETILKEKGKMKTEIKQTAEAITLVAEDVTGLSAELVVQAGAISTEVTDRTNADATLQSGITQNADAITLKVSQTDLDTQLTDYSTITQTAENITTAVTETKSYADGKVSESAQSILEQTSESISTRVSKSANYAAAYRGESAPADINILWFDTISNIYKYYNTVSGLWEVVDGASIYSAFKQTVSGFELKGNVDISGNLITSGKISTANFEGTGNDHIQMQREFLTFVDAGTPDLVKMAMGFVQDKDGVGVPGIVFGAGDGQGNSRGYITKSTDGLDIFYITSSGGVARLRLDDDGKLYLNETEVPAFDPNSPIPSDYLAQGATWNTAVLGTLNGGSYKVGTSKIIDGAVTDAKIASLTADKITAGTITGIDIVGSKFWNSDNLAYIVAGTRSGNYADISTCRNNNTTPVFQVYDDTSQIILKKSDVNFLMTSGAYTYPRGTWDFGEATAVDFTGTTVTGITAKFA